MFARLDSQIPGPRFICRFFLLVAVLVGAGCIAQATTFTVNKTADTNDGFCNADCSLREAIVAANNTPGADVITFNTGTVLTPTTPLPAITDSLTIDGGTVNGYPFHEISGTLAGANADGLVVSSPVVVTKITVIIKNLAIYRFGRHGIFVNSFSGVNFTLLNCALGTDAAGTVDQGNGQNGLRILAYANSTFNVGSTTPTDQNVISGNNSDGIAIVTASNISNANTQIFIINNNIGTNDIGSAKLGNTGNGISFTGASTGYQLTIGGPQSTSRNLISGNGQNGIYAVSNQLLVYGNYIGPGFSGHNGLGNSLDGIRLDGNVDATIGGTLNGNGPAFDGGNVISGNGGDGVNIVNHNATVTIKRNLIGINAGQSGALANAGYGVEIKDPSSFAPTNVLIGSKDSASDFNVISGNANYGISIDEKVGKVEIYGNRIGLSGDLATNVPNLGGIRILSTQNKVGEAGNGTAANFIGRNTQNGILLTGPSATANEIYRNFIGTTANDSNQGNQADGILIDNGASGNKIGNGLASGLNKISFNGGNGVSVAAGSNNSVRGNWLSSNSGLGINLGPNGVASNDAGDADSGANDLQNYPVIVRAHPGQIIGSFNSTPNSEFVIDYYSVSSCNASGNGEGGNPLGSDTQVVTDQNGNANLNFAPSSAPAGFVTATATRTGSGTSEFSKCVPVTPDPGSVKFSAANYSTSESSNVPVKVTRVNGTDSFSVSYSTQDGSAKAGVDYTAKSGLVTFNVGELSKTIDIPILNDTLDENDEAFTVVLTGLPPDVTLGTPSTATVTIKDDDPLPKFSISDFQTTEGNSGTKDFTFNVSLSAASSFDTTVEFFTDADSSNDNDYQNASGTLTFVAGETQKTIVVKVNGDTLLEEDEVFLVKLTNPTNAEIGKGQGNGTIINDDTEGGTTVQFSQASFDVQEDLTAAIITVIRTGDTSGTTTVDYFTEDDTATQKSDYEIASGTLTFLPEETSKTFVVLINEDSYVEGSEKVNLYLSNVTGGIKEEPFSAVLNIMDDAVESPGNSLDDAQSFVYTHYHDFLNREPDPAGLAFWTNEITSCGNDANCVEAKRVNVSASFFASIEFQETGFLRYLIEKESFGTMPKYATFMQDLQEVSRGLIVNSPGWQQKLADNQRQFADTWINRPDFKAAYGGLSDDAYVTALYQNAGIVPSQAEKDKLVGALNTAGMNRSAVLLEVASDASFRQQEQNRAFVLMQYFGYLRRDPNALPDTDLSGYNFWLNKLNQFGGNYVDAEMVKAFITSIEYRQRFGQ